MSLRHIGVISGILESTGESKTKWIEWQIRTMKNSIERTNEQMNERAWKMTIENKTMVGRKGKSKSDFGKETEKEKSPVNKKIEKT